MELTNRIQVFLDYVPERNKVRVFTEEVSMDSIELSSYNFEAKTLEKIRNADGMFEACIIIEGYDKGE